MIFDSLVSPVTLGFVLGLQHATDPDHLVAVATIVTRERRFAAGALVGAFWGLGHMATLTVVGGALLVLNRSLGPPVTTGLELVVAAMLVALGLVRLRDAARGITTVGPEHLASDHEHGHTETVHSHPHVHDHGKHGHPHVHPSRELLAVLSGDGRRLAARATLVGVVHGMAGTAAVSLLVMATLRSAAGAVLYLVVFGVGTIAGMTALTAAMAYPVALAGRFTRARRVLAVGAGAGSIVFGIVYALRAI